MNKITFEKIARHLAKLELPPFDLIIGIGRGGIIPAAMVGYKLGCDVDYVFFNYRNADHQPCHDEPVLLESFVLPKGKSRVLLVDDIAVSGKTLNTAKILFKEYQLKTLVFVGQADYVLLPEIKGCVDWPWKKIYKPKEMR